MSDKEQKIDDKQPGRDGGASQPSDQKKEKDRGIDDDIDDDREEVSQCKDAPGGRGVRQSRQPLRKSRHQKTNIKNKCHPGEET